LISDPLIRLKKFLIKNHDFSEQHELEINRQCKEEIETAVNNYFALPARSGQDLFNNLYKQLPDELQLQKDSIE
jgi:TPP-dependent pyruvate/acetoin dehydrogenase alpha subunit